MKVVLIGIQGAGKSTHGNMLSNTYHVPYLSSGHIFRQMAKEKTPTGRLVKETINSGHLISDEMTIQVVREYLSRPEYEKGYILDGFPRTVVQAAEFEKDIDKAVFLRISDREALWRIAGRESDREDETLHAVKKRIELFHEKTEPVIDYYRDRGDLIEVDAEEDVDDVHEAICKRLVGV